MNEWDSPGKRRLNFTNGGYKTVIVASFIRDANGIPALVLGEDGAVYPWCNIISIGPVKEK